MSFLPLPRYGSVTPTVNTDPGCCLLWQLAQQSQSRVHGVRRVTPHCQRRRWTQVRSMAIQLHPLFNPWYAQTMVTDFRQGSSKPSPLVIKGTEVEPSPLVIKGTEVEVVHRYKWLGTFPDGRQDWSANGESPSEKRNQRLH